VDAFYLLPLHFRFENCVLLVDFARRRKAFHLVTFPGEMPRSLQLLPKGPPHATVPVEQIKQFARREYPDLGSLWLGSP
jgi:hypothetical protein